MSKEPVAIGIGQTPHPAEFSHPVGCWNWVLPLFQNREALGGSFRREVFKKPLHGLAPERPVSLTALLFDDKHPALVIHGQSDGHQTVW